MPRHYSSWEAYRKAEAYKHIHGIVSKDKFPYVYVRGVKHKVKHL